MEITDKAELDRIMREYGELQDGLFVFAGQGEWVCDTHVCRGADADGTEYYFVTEYTHIGDHADICNVSFLGGFDFAEYEETSVIAYTTRQEMTDHINRFMVARNHF